MSNLTNSNITRTLNQYDKQVNICQTLFEQKTKDYGTAWRILRPSSLTDQLFIKAQRIRTLEENGSSAVGEGILPEYIALVNYSIMALVQMELMDDTLELAPKVALDAYTAQMDATRKLMIKKNKDYGEAWRDMRITSLTDLILMKLLRIKQIEDHNGQTVVSEGIDAGYMDIINYALFALIRMEEASV